MKTELKLKINLTTILVLVSGVVFFFWINSRYNANLGASLETIEQHEWTIEQKQSEIDSLKLTFQQALDVKEETLREYLAKDSSQMELIKYYKDLSSVVRVETKFVHDTVEVEVPIYIENDTVVEYSDPCFKADLSFKSGLFSLAGVSIDNTQDIVIGTQKRGLSRAETYVSIRNSNPCIQTTGMQSYNIVYEKKWWENPLITGGIGATAGFIGGMIVNR